MKMAVALFLFLAVAVPAWAQSAAPGTAKPPAPADKRQPAARPPAPKIDARAVLQAMEEAFSAVADRVTPAVVNVSTVSKRPAPGSGDDPERFREYFGEEFFERYFKRRSPRDEPRASGSGVIVDRSGYILTNNHVIENAQDITVRLSDSRKLSATLVGRDPKTDLAVLKIDATGPLPTAELGDSERLRVGQWVIAIKDVNDELAASFGVREREGVLVDDVVKGGPAEVAGLRPGDVIIELNGTKIREVPDLQRRVANVTPGQSVAVGVVRDRAAQKLRVRVGEMPSDDALVTAEVPGPEGFGLQVEPLAPDSAERLSLPFTEGLL